MIGQTNRAGSFTLPATAMTLNRQPPQSRSGWLDVVNLRWNIETTIVVPGAFTSGTNHFAHSGSPEDKARLQEYESGPTANLGKQIAKGFELTAVLDADVSDVAKAIVAVVDMPFGTRPFRVHIDPANDGAEIVNGVADHVRTDMLRNMGLADLLKPSSAMDNAKKAS